MGRLITIDGPSGSGKSSVAALVAKRLGFHPLDSGALYRAVALLILEAGVTLDDDEALKTLLTGVNLEGRFGVNGFEVVVNGAVINDRIRGGEVSRFVSPVAALPRVRTFLIAHQRALAEQGDLVADGRDMGTVVFPDAGAKFYLDASPLERARRRMKDFAALGEQRSLGDIEREIRERDTRDSQRACAPLRVPDGAQVIDTEGLSLDAVACEIIARLPPSWRA